MVERGAQGAKAQAVERDLRLAVTFTILTNEGQDPIVKQAIDALKSAVHEGV